MKNDLFIRTLVGDHYSDKALRDEFNALIKEKTFKNRQIILKPGEVAKYMWLIITGWTMSYVDKADKKIPYVFHGPGELIIEVKSFFRKAPSDVAIQAIEKTTLFCISYDDLFMLLKKYPYLYESLIDRLEDLEVSVQERLIQYLSLSAEERYAALLEERPEIVLKAPVEYVAAYLGFSRKTLNRIRDSHRKSRRRSP
ncbi:Crp/Fnr family transcriptional regulator [Pararcticibacter amylolyticus]|uniref:Cyclic nucleotide-binding domain-containing protein n=1 Tax=Pararcticibacter amylolyticus TaxID=2173175 RepID=A0A2U2PFM2_9SPHI|nr:Crp/Fnr family transcriptional regulator [Pararcticibacter amylolyticus]PWG80205.1 hypothetical protein DDR33_13510 [Pararcticibacter amylolyticus]